MHLGARVIVLLAVVATVVTGVLVTSAARAPAATPQAKTVSVKKWATSVCTDIGEWEHRVTTLEARGAPADPAAGKAAITKFLKGALQATETLAKHVKIAGVPSVENGKAIEAGLVSSVTSLRAAYVTAKTDAAALPTTDAAAFSSAAQALAAQLQAASAGLITSLADVAQGSPRSALDTAFTSTHACASLI